MKKATTEKSMKGMKKKWAYQKKANMMMKNRQSDNNTSIKKLLKKSVPMKSNQTEKVKLIMVKANLTPEVKKRDVAEMATRNRVLLWSKIIKVNSKGLMKLMAKILEVNGSINKSHLTFNRAKICMSKRSETMVHRQVWYWLRAEDLEQAILDDLTMKLR